MIENRNDLSGRKRLDYIDVAKGLGIISVMFAHGCGYPGNLGYYIGACFMQAFFFLSGFTYQSGRQAKESIKKRFQRIGGTYFFYNAVLLVLSFLAYKVLHKEVSEKFWMTAVVGIFYSSSHLYYPDSTIPNISFYNIQNAALWYLTCLLVSSSLFYLVVERLKDRKRAILTIMLLLGITIGLSRIPIRLPWSIDTAFAGTILMLLGYWTKKGELVEKYERWYIIAPIILIYIILCRFNPGIGMSLRKYGPYIGWSVVLFVIIGYLGSLLFVYCARLICRYHRITRIFCYIGKKTLPILGFHSFLFLVWNTVAERLGILQKSYWLNGIGQIVVTLLFCLMGSYFWKKVCLMSAFSQYYNPDSHEQNTNIR